MLQSELRGSLCAVAFAVIEADLGALWRLTTAMAGLREANDSFFNIHVRIADDSCNAPFLSGLSGCFSTILQVHTTMQGLVEYIKYTCKNVFRGVQGGCQIGWEIEEIQGARGRARRHVAPL